MSMLEGDQGLSLFLNYLPQEREIRGSLIPLLAVQRRRTTDPFIPPASGKGDIGARIPPLPDRGKGQGVLGAVSSCSPDQQPFKARNLVMSPCLALQCFLCMQTEANPHIK